MPSHEIVDASTGRALAEARALVRAHVAASSTRHDGAALDTRLYTNVGFRPIAPYRGAELGDTLFYELWL